MPNSKSMQLRPPIDPFMAAIEFERWYWSVSQLRQFCSELSLPKSGTKAELRRRISYALANPGKARLQSSSVKKTGSFNWSKESLTRETAITENVSFGPNFRSFFKSEIGPNFICHSDFMEWVRSNTGATLGEAIEAWLAFEERKDDPSFRRELASCNNYLQYLRDARDWNPSLSLDDAKLCWEYKKVRPAHDGFVVFEESDIIEAGISDE